MLRVQLLLRIAFAHTQMILYRPFLHHVMNCPSDQPANPKSYACASACVKAAKQVVRLLGDMNDHGLLSGAYWFTVFTTFLAIMSLIMYIINNPSDPQREHTLRLAESGRQILVDLSVRSLTADRCATFLKVIFLDLLRLHWPQGLTFVQPLFDKLQTSCKATHGNEAVDRGKMPSQPQNGPWDQWTGSRTMNAEPGPSLPREVSQDSGTGTGIRSDTITPTHAYFLDELFQSSNAPGEPEQQQFPETSQQQDPHAMFYASMDPSEYIDPSMLSEMPIEDGTRFLAGTPTHWLENNYLRPVDQDNSRFSDQSTGSVPALQAFQPNNVTSNGPFSS